MAGSAAAAVTPAARPTSAVRSTRRALVALLAALLLAGALELALVGPSWGTFLYLSVAGAYLGAGTLAWWWRPSNALGAVMIFGCLSLLNAGLLFSTVPLAAAAGTVGASLILAVVVHLLHAFPSGRLRGRVSRWTVLGGYATSLVLQAPQYLFSPAPPPNHLLSVADRPSWAAAGATVQSTVGAVVIVVTTGVLMRRLWAADPPRRRVLAPLYTYGMVAVLSISVLSNLIGPLLGLSLTTVGTVQLVLVAGVPLAFCLALLRGGFARTGEVEELGTWLGASVARTSLGEALARTLGDPSLRVALWVADEHGYVDASGEPVDLPARGGDRAVVEVDVEGRRVGAIDYDATLLTDPGPVRAAGRVVALAVDRARLTAQLRAGEQALRRSRARLLEAADLERRRIAQNLHDGLQARLVLLAVDAQRIASDPAAAPSTTQAAAALRAAIDDAAGDLRRFVHGVMPAPLQERGLAAAAEDLADHLPLPTSLEVGVPAGAVPPAVERTAYLILAEALTNAVRHAQAARLTVRIVVEDERLVLEVGDDGVGGARAGGGLGLRGIADRVDVLGGSLDLDSPPGAGTRLRAELPCAS